MSQDVSSDVRLSMTRNARAWRAGIVTTGAAVNPSEMAGRVNGSAVLRCAPALQVTPQARCGSEARYGMVRPGRDRLRGTVEVDETYVGGEEEGVWGRETYTKTLVGVAAEEAGNAIGRIRLATLKDASDVSLLPFVEEPVEPGSVVHTAGWTGYRDLPAKGYRHEVTNITRSRT